MRRRVLLLTLLSSALPSRLQAAPTAYQRRLLLDLDGKTTSLAAAAAGRALVVVTMKGHWCAACRDQLERFATHREQLLALGATVVGLNADPPAANRAVVEQQAMSFPILSDRQHQVLEALDLWLRGPGYPMPAVLVFDSCGVERGRWLGRRPGVGVEQPVLARLGVLEETSCEPPRA